MLQQCHDGMAHLGRDATWEKMNNYNWPGYYKDMKSYLMACSNCQFYDNANYGAPANPVEVNEFSEQWGLDLVGPFPLTPDRNKYIIVATEYYTCWPVARAYPEATKEVAAKFLYEVLFSTYGPPTKLLTDQGNNFRNELLHEFCKLVGTQHKFATPYHPQANGLAERFNRTLVLGLKN